MGTRIKNDITIKRVLCVCARSYTNKCVAIFHFCRPATRTFLNDTSPSSLSPRTARGNTKDSLVLLPTAIGNIKDDEHSESKIDVGVEVEEEE